ncbi:MAG: hypothetical protein O6940_14000 [Ignavibacteria bacterium]|nr:hypothetical protein [Ignavibacteria bacterium]
MKIGSQEILFSSFFSAVFTTLFILALPLLSPECEVFAQDEKEQVRYYQMETLDDSLFIKIQEELFIEPPDPKAEIIVDLRNENNQTITIKGTLYPLLAISSGVRARIVTYQFKLDLEEPIHYASVFTSVIKKIKLNKLINPPTKFQVSSTMQYINPFMQLFGGERFGWSLNNDVGFSFGIGTRYSGPLESNYVEIGFHLLGFYGGFIKHADGFPELKSTQMHNNLYVNSGFRLSYVIPLGNFFELGYVELDDFTGSQAVHYTEKGAFKNSIVYNPDSTIKYQPYLAEGTFLTYELRYPLKVMGSTRGKFYIAKFLDEWHLGYTGRELSLAGSVFDFRFDAMVSSPVRQTQYVIDILIQKIFSFSAFSSIAVGPSGILGTSNDGSFGFTSIFVNIRFKMGTSL